MACVLYWLAVCVDKLLQCSETVMSMSTTEQTNLLCDLARPGYQGRPGTQQQQQQQALHYRSWPSCSWPSSKASHCMIAAAHGRMAKLQLAAHAWPNRPASRQPGTAVH